VVFSLLVHVEVVSKHSSVEKDRYIDSRPINSSYVHISMCFRLGAYSIVPEMDIPFECSII
jgi:hypothetical protein